MIEFASGQITGKRAAQEDALDVVRLQPGVTAPELATGGGFATTSLESGLVMVVADGMGGHVGGRVASTLCVGAFVDSVRQSDQVWETRLEDGLTRANEALRQETMNRPELAGMGSTLVGAVIGADGLGWISIGDSGLYLFRDRNLVRLNEDHSFGAYLDQQARDGLMTEEAAASDRRRNHLFYALLGDELDHYEQFSGFRALMPGDLVVVASDGLKTLADERLAEILDEAVDLAADAIVRTLIAAVEAEDRDRQDNVSIIVARIAAPESVPGIAAPQLTVRDAPTSNAARPKPPAPTPPFPAERKPVMPETRQPRPNPAAKVARSKRLGRWRLVALALVGLALIAYIGVSFYRQF